MTEESGQLVLGVYQSWLGFAVPQQVLHLQEQEVLAGTRTGILQYGKVDRVGGLGGLRIWTSVGCTPCFKWGSRGYSE